MNNYLKYILWAVLLVLLQVLVLNNIQFSGYVNPFVYLLFIIVLPVNIPKYALLLVGFMLGITIDVFANTPGIHASATVFVAWARPFVIDSISQRDQFEEAMVPGISKFGFWWFFRYVTLMVFLHHTFIFFVEAFTFINFIQTITRIILSAVFSIVIIIITQMIVFRNK